MVLREKRALLLTWPVVPHCISVDCWWAQGAALVSRQVFSQAALLLAVHLRAWKFPQVSSHHPQCSSSCLRGLEACERLKGREATRRNRRGITDGLWDMKKGRWKWKMIHLQVSQALYLSLWLQTVLPGTQILSTAVSLRLLSKAEETSEAEDTAVVVSSTLIGEVNMQMLFTVLCISWSVESFLSGK